MSFKEALTYFRSVLTDFNANYNFNKAWEAFKVIGDTLGGIFYPNTPAFLGVKGTKVKMTPIKRVPGMKALLREIDDLIALDLDSTEKPAGFKAAKLKGIPDWLLPILAQILAKWMTGR